jgi:hypothetical protein
VGRTAAANREQHRIQPVSLRQLPGTPREFPHVARIDDHHGKSGRDQRTRDVPMIGPRRFQHDQGGGGGAQLRDERRDATHVMLDLRYLAFMHRDVQPRRADVDSHITSRLHAPRSG